MSIRVADLARSAHLAQSARLAQWLAGAALPVNKLLEKASNGKTTNRERQWTREENCDH
jgi:hypothetical protein